MKDLLDSNVCVDYLTGRFPQVTRRMQSLMPADLCLSSIAVTDFATVPTRVRRQIETTSFAALEKKGQLIGPNDMLIAAH